MLSIATQLDRNISLIVGAVQESVTVAGEAPPIDTTRAEIAGVVTSQQIDSLPTNTRQYLNLALLMPGTTQDASRTFYNSVQIGGGGRYYANGFSVDGVTNNWAEMGEPRQNFPTGAVQEFKVNTNQYRADQGLAMGGMINIVTKSGTNHFHGELFEYFRHSSLNREDRFKKQAEASTGTGKAPFLRNQWGGDIGGPIVKNRAFFFYSYEADRRVTQSGVSRTVPMASLGQGLVRYTNPSGGLTSITAAQMLTIFPSLNGENAKAVAALAAAASKYPANDCSLGDRCVNTGGFRFNAATPVQLNSHAAKFDINLTQRQQIFARANVIYDKTVQAPNFPDRSYAARPRGIANRTNRPSSPIAGGIWPKLRKA
jgi:hypothetical protein